MAISTSIAQKISGIVFIIMGCIAFFMVFGPIANIAKTTPEEINGGYYSTIILLACGLYFFTLGVSFYTGILKPSFMSQDKFEENKMELLGSIFMLPVAISFSIMIFSYSKSTHWKIIWLLFLVYAAYNLFDNVSNYRKNKKITQQNY